MRITFVRPHESITSLPEIELPDFSLITGANGVGKTHLLQAIESGQIRVAEHVISQKGLSIRLFDWNSIVPQDGIGTEINSIVPLVNEYRSAIRQVLSNGYAMPAFNEARRAFPALAQRYSHTENDHLFSASIEDLEKVLGSAAAALEARRLLDQDLPRVELMFFESLRADMREAMKVIASRVAKPFFLLTENEILEGALSALPEQPAFQQSFARLFAAYRDARLENRMAELEARDNPDQIFLNQDQFVEIYGPAPWEVVNRCLEAAHLPFKVSIPNLKRYEAYVPSLIHVDSGKILQFSSLSSGEKVLLSFALCIYFAEDRRQLTSFPAILLLDEIDATLHPSMSKALIDIIQQTLVDDCGIKVIATTHSPSTVALAPESSIHIMRKDVGLTKCTKAEALNLLTEGVPFLALSYEGRRQVFVESDVDAEVYGLLYENLREALPLGRSLTFVAVGSEVNGGCDRVLTTVHSLADAGNSSVFGLIDWDGSRKAQDRIEVMALDSRHSIENITLDPLIVASAICREFPDKFEEIGLSKKTTWRQFMALPEAEFLRVVEAVTTRVVGQTKETVVSRYSGGLNLHVNRAALTMRGHDWEDAVLSTYPYLRRIGQSSQELKNDAVKVRIVKLILADCPEFIPLEVKSAFENLLSRPAH